MASNGTSSTNYGSIRANLDSASSNDAVLSRVEVNQRALIDKILARYASQGAVYRELIQNSNDADASCSEIYFTSDEYNTVSQVVYRNNGMPFRGQDWDRLKKIAEGNPDVSKVGAFGVGAYTMFSICEEPLVLSGDSALAFIWKGDALWTKTIPNKTHDPKWTSFVLPSRDPYQLPNLVQFGEFLCASLTFTAKLRSLKVFVNDVEKLHIQKTIAQPPRLVQTPKSNTINSSAGLFSMIWNVAASAAASADSSAAITSSTKGIFSLAKSNDQSNPNAPAIYESIHRMTVSFDGSTASLEARYVSATAKTNIPTDMARRMERVTKKNPPSTVDIQIFLNAAQLDISTSDKTSKKKTKADKIVHSFLPTTSGQGRIFIGFRTSQTTGLAAHLAAPFVPTVEREAMDLQDAALRIFNTELLEFSGILMRLTLEHTMLNVIGVQWENNKASRLQEEQELLKKINIKHTNTSNGHSDTTSMKDLSTIETDDENDDDAGDNDDDSQGGDGEDADGKHSKGVLMGFARFMARGVKKSIVSVAKTIGNLVEGTSDPLLYPPDPRPLSLEEKQAIVLMQSFCPQQSTPDATVGTYLATGFSRCLPNQSPPVLTRAGVVRGDLARLPNLGIETFCPNNTIRSVVYQNCIEYHTVIARCRKLSIDDLYESLSSQVLEEEKMIQLIHWWVQYSRVEPVDSVQKGLSLKQLIKFYPLDDPQAPIAPQTTSKGEDNSNAGERQVVLLQQYQYSFDKESYYATRPILPLPDYVLPRRLHNSIGYSLLYDGSLYQWFQTLPIEVWADFISSSNAMTDGESGEYESIRINVLTVLSQEYSKRLSRERIVFGGFCHSLLANKRCIPFDSPESNVMMKTDYPGDLYLSSAELKAFQGVGGSSTFRKVSASLQAAGGVSDDFLLVLGVRKSVSIDFLFTNLDTLKWSEDPKPLIEYLRTATLSAADRTKLSTTQYLPAENDTQKTFAPSQLYLPNSELRIFPFVKILQWPSESEVSDKSSNGQFMVQLGMRTLPPLDSVMEYMCRPDLDPQQHAKCLDFLCDRLGPHGAYHASYNQLSFAKRKEYRFLPCRVHDPIEACFASISKNRVVPQQQRCSTVSCFSDEICSIMGFPVMEPNVTGKKNSRLHGSLLQCEAEPSANALLQRLTHLVTQAKSRLDQTSINSEIAELMEATFASIFKYMSQRTSDISLSSLEQLKGMAFIPVKVDEMSIEWYRPDQVFFQRKDNSQDSITAELFRIIEFNAFLSAVGVKEEATTRDLFVKILNSPDEVLRMLGNEKKYRSVLRRIAANPPFQLSRVPQEVKNSPFLLGYTVKYEENTGDSSSSTSPPARQAEITSHHLAKASDIYIIDNSFFARMFPVKRAPPETDLEDFYARLGSRYISQSVDRRFEIVGKATSDTSLTNAFKERLLERAPLLVSPSITSRPLVQNASSLLESKHLQIFEVKNLLAVYSLEGTVRRNQTTCCSREIGRNANAIYVVKDFDWFDVGYAIGDMILKRCQLEDAFFISSLLEAPLEQLRSRGFPVDRILQSEPPPSPQKEQPKPNVQAEKPAVAIASKAVNTPTVAQIPSPTVAQIPPPSVSTPQAPTMPGSNTTKNRPNEQVQASGSGKADPAPTENLERESNPYSLSPEGMHQILMQMFPGADPSAIMTALGKNPTIDDVRNLAEKMATENYSERDESQSTVASSGGSVAESSASKDIKPDKKGGASLGKKLGRAFGFGNKNTSSAPPLVPANTKPPPTSGLGLGTGVGAGMGFPPPSAMGAEQEHTEQRNPVAPASDVQSQRSLESMLENAIGQSSSVNPGGIESNNVKLTSIPKELDHDCEVIPGQSLKPFPGPRGTCKTRNGIRVFSSRQYPASEVFLNEFDPVLESFAHVIERLCVGVFNLKVDSLAIFHDPSGRTIAFNSNRSLHFNIRYFHSLHFLQNKHLGIECYSYWYMTIAHELAHHMVSAHTREHGFYTESYASHFLPNLVVLLNDL